MDRMLSSLALASRELDPAYPDVCVPPPPPDLDCADIPYRNFRVLPPDPYRSDGDNDRHRVRERMNIPERYLGRKAREGLEAPHGLGRLGDDLKPLGPLIE